MNKTVRLKIKSPEKVGDNENSVQNRKEQKRREAELRQQTAPLRKKSRN